MEEILMEIVESVAEEAVEIVAKFVKDNRAKKLKEKENSEDYFCKKKPKKKKRMSLSTKIIRRQAIKRANGK